MNGKIRKVEELLCFRDGRNLKNAAPKRLIHFNCLQNQRMQKLALLIMLNPLGKLNAVHDLATQLHTLDTFVGNGGNQFFTIDRKITCCRDTIRIGVNQFVTWGTPPLFDPSVANRLIVC